MRGTAEIEAGLRDMRDGKTIEGKTRIVKAIFDIVSREAGPKTGMTTTKHSRLRTKFL